MKVIGKVIAVLTLAVMVAAPLSAQAAEKKLKSEVVMKVGSKVHLFHSGTADVKKEICVGDTLSVYRETGGAKNPQAKEVGKVKVLDYAGEHYFEAEVLSGDVKTGDVTKKGSTACLVQPSK